MKTSRRNFLKVAGLSAFALAGGALAPKAVQAGTTPIGQSTGSGIPGQGSYSAVPGAITAKRFAMVIDTRAFDSYEAFQTVINACHTVHNVPSLTGPQEIKWLWDDIFVHAFPDDPTPMLSDEIKQRRFLLLCNHCANPSCVRVCPAGATYKTPQGLVAIDYHRCVGCRFCMAACPYGSRSFNFKDPLPFIENINPAFPARMRGVVEKCTFCAERLEKGQMPACVEASNGAILFGDLEDPESEVRQALAENFSIRRKPSLGTEPGVYYII